MNTKERILEEARKEFMENGFAEASMRNIAKKVGITATALYRHYDNKEEIFDAVVAPAARAWEAFCEQESVRQPRIVRDRGLEAMWNDDSQLPMVVEMIYKHFDEHKLLFCQSEGTKYADFFHQLITRVQDCTLAFMEELERNGVCVKSVNPQEMHLLLSAEYSAIIEMLEHGFSKEDALHYARTVTRFFTFGWRDYLGF